MITQLETQSQFLHRLNWSSTVQKRNKSIDKLKLRQHQVEYFILVVRIVC